MEKIQDGPLDKSVDLPSVMVVDDMPDNRLLMEIYLRPYKLKVFMAKSGEEALDQFAKLSPDLILMDIQMPGINGYEAARKLRELGFKKPLIALTAFTQREEMEKCKAAGFDFVLTKPVGRQLLGETLQRYLHPATH